MEGCHLICRCVDSGAGSRLFSGKFNHPFAPSIDRVDLPRLSRLLHDLSP